MTDTGTDASAPLRRNPTRRAIMAILAFQLAIAAVLAGSDLISALPSLLSPSRAPAMDQPVAPGDQVRRFRPSDLPGREADPSRQTQLPDPGNMPSRLLFSAEGDDFVLTGSIEPGDAARFEDWLDLQAPTSATTIRLHSPGGSVSDALAIGRTIRDASLATRLGPGDICLSACPYILAGGITRTVPASARVGVHQHYFGENTALPAFLAVEDIQRGQGEVMAYLDTMGIDVRLMQPALTTPPDAIYILLPEELEEYRLITN